ncbi:MAG: hypothetical protein KKB81_06085 [Candidatus Margulisbacteria bacterium]|nr:hypothetical protein [Candidatus Margulisiibacteriota bacterium]MBU1021430.1 hypothetical protein [Candidatus Margulisiibacteriota bacterium]MBU1728351.1 hypothetical protein [Candidatus Margulisiibacteriota bacterium]MBU1955906.1 hypothetical protein [Candidatus Margulisiibacteriota bacterium]
MLFQENSLNYVKQAMKKIIALVIMMGLMLSLTSAVFADPQDPTNPAEAKMKIPAVKQYIAQREQQLAQEMRKPPAKRSAKRIANLKQIIAQQKLRLKRLENIAAEGVKPPPPPQPQPTPEAAKPMTPKEPVTKFGGNINYIAGAMGIEGEYVFKVPAMKDIVGLDNFWASLGAGYGQGNNSSATSTKMIYLFADGALDLETSLFPKSKTYFGGELNYVVYRSGQAAGSFAGAAFIGTEGKFLDIGGAQYFEIGYGMLRPYNGGSFKGIIAKLGWRLPM